MNIPILDTANSKVNEFINELAPIVVNEYNRRLKKSEKVLFPSTVLAMAACESGWNLEAATLFGIKGDGVELNTQEYIDGAYVDIKDSFIKFPNTTLAVVGLYDLMQWNHYDLATSSNNYIDECNNLQAAGYATSPSYAETLINITNDFDLLQFNIRFDDNEEDTENTDETPENVYIVKKGDNLWNIVKDFYNLDESETPEKVEEVARNNNIDNPALIYEGMEINL